MGCPRTWTSGPKPATWQPKKCALLEQPFPFCIKKKEHPKIRLLEHPFPFVAHPRPLSGPPQSAESRRAGAGQRRPNEASSFVASSLRRVALDLFKPRGFRALKQPGFETPKHFRGVQRGSRGFHGKPKPGAPGNGNPRPVSTV